MEIYISQNSERTGPFSPQEIQAGLANGQYQTSDLIWYQGIEGWIPLSAALHILSSGPTIQPTPQPTSCGLATASMILGISGFVFLITAIPAIICGHIARDKIKKSQGLLQGNGMALAGLITGYLGLGLLLIACMAALTAPMIMQQIKRAHQVEAISNAKQIGLALYEFEDEYGNYPNAATASLVAAKNHTPEIIGSSSNARFRQLFSAGITASEELFYAKTSNTRKPDGITVDNEAIAPNECGFGYIDNIPPKITDSRPIAMAPFIPGTNKFDPEPFSGKAVILWTNNSVSTLPIDRNSGEAILDGKSILNPSHPIWQGTPPNLVLPE